LNNGELPVLKNKCIRIYLSSVTSVTKLELNILSLALNLSLPGAVTSVACSPDGTRVVSGSHDKSLRICTTGEIECMLEGHLKTVSSDASSPDGISVVSGSWNDSVRIWNPSTGGSLLPEYEACQLPDEG
jgi:WD40 repeat protein